jgi:cell wall-associated NlpC family hydrolase
LRRIVPFFLAFAASLTLAGKAFADDNTLTLDLPPSQRALDERAAAEKARSSAAAASRPTAHQSVHIAGNPPPSRGSLPSRGGSPGRVVGRLGEIQGRTSIYRTQRRSGKLATVQPGLYIAITDELTNWYGVYMSDGTTGWVSKSYVRLLDYQVMANGAPSLPDLGNGSIQPRTGAEFFTGDPQALLREAYKYMGVPYQWGGNTEAGIDCSGFMKKIFFACGYSLPRTAAEQTGLGLPIQIDQLQCGDRLYFGHGSRITHTGLYIGNGYFIHSSAGEHGVAISRLTDTTYMKIFVCARR